jgi:hypothetical protein
VIPEERLGQLLGLGEAWRVVEARLEASSSTFLMKVEETPDLWLEESSRAEISVTCKGRCGGATGMSLARIS